MIKTKIINNIECLKTSISDLDKDYYISIDLLNHICDLFDVNLESLNPCEILQKLYFEKDKKEIKIRGFKIKKVLKYKTVVIYYYQLKTDGNYSAFICDFDGEKSIISRGKSTVTKEYCHLEDRLFFFDSIATL